MKIRATALLLTVLVIAMAGLVYELLAGALASYVLGDSVTQFSTTIGAYLFAMGIGSYLSKFVHRGLARRFIEIELCIGLVGGLATPILFLSFAYTAGFSVLLYGFVGAVGLLVGLEIPILLRILKDELEFRDLIARVLSVDYFGALIASLAFALFFVPRLGLVQTSLVFGLASAAAALFSVWILREMLRPAERWRLSISGVLLVAILLAALISSNRIVEWGEQALFSNPIVLTKQTRYQRIVVTRDTRSAQLFLDGHLQFSSSDEYRYHEALVHPAMAAATQRVRVLIMGGGDGLAAREVLRYPEVERVDMVDLDPGITDMARDYPLLRALNAESMHDPRVHVNNADAFVWARNYRGAPYDIVIADFPDPRSYSLGKLYSRSFYRKVHQLLADDGAMVVQSTSPFDKRKAFWCVVGTVEEAGFEAAPYHVTVPSFGQWGFVLAQKQPVERPIALRMHPLRFLTDDVLASAFDFPADMARLDVRGNRLHEQSVVNYYDEED